MFDGDNCVSNALDFCLKLKGEKKELPLIRKLLNITNNCTLIVVVVFDTRIVLDNHPRDKHIVDIIKNGESKISLRVFIGYIHIGKK